MMGALLGLCVGVGLALIGTNAAEHGDYMLATFEWALASGNIILSAICAARD